MPHEITPLTGPFAAPISWLWSGHDQNPGGRADLTKPAIGEMVFGIITHAGMFFSVDIPRRTVIASIQGNAKRLPMAPNLPGSDYLGCPDHTYPLSSGQLCLI